MGDSVDNVPGVPGVGPKTATPADPAIWRPRRRCSPSTDEITKPKLKQNLIEHADMARLSRELVRLVCDAPLPEPLEELALKGIPPEPLQGIPRGPGLQVAAQPHGRRRRAERRRAGRLTSWRRRQRRPSRPAEAEKIAVDRTHYETVDRRGARPLDRRGARARAMSRSTPRPTASTASSPSWSGSASRPSPTRPATSRSAMAAATSIPTRRTSLPLSSVLEQAEAAARGPGGPQDRPQPQVRLGDVRQARASRSRPTTTRW